MNPTFLEKLLGANWRTTLYGSIAILAGFIHEYPDLIGALFAPDVAKKIALWGGAIGTFLVFANAKDRQVSGNGTVVDPAKVAQPDGSNKTLPFSIIAVGLFFPVAMLGLTGLTGCAWFKDPGNQAKLEQTGFFLLRKAGEIALNTVASKALSANDASAKADWLDSFAAGARADISSDDIRSLIGIWTPDKSHWQDLGAQLTDLAKQYPTLTPQQRNEAIAKALNDAAAKLRAQAANPTQVWHVPAAVDPATGFPLPTLYSDAEEPIHPQPYVWPQPRITAHLRD